ncbi:MAG: histidine kinase [Gammaproteobacteria bacterium (ex Lamellibrachia satsuma)]|nr:MAG: HDOD domain-containing protein [Gammaproteobacteria bacterium (ex Lamellibrachia satsuma)]RRS31749.1 MAG: histidine kinase [Gammaproteobacteria bacterium (ex Lamellibrachia satsuma)]RRS35345.1 MAG: histidine kinase [Gammaproteobacteria bacterium (ex Lamellibrachia satsuma)]
MIDENAFLDSIFKAIDEHKLTLPTLPEVALRVRDAVESEDSTAQQIAKIVATDAALSARLLQVANSPLYRGSNPIDNLQMAVARLGTRLVRSLVVSLIMQQIFQATCDILDKRFRQLWEESVQIAAISRVLAQNLKHLDREQAMLAGLIHNIGALPVLTMAEHSPELISDQEELDRVIEALSPRIGKRILEDWDFPESLIKVPAHFQDLGYDGGTQADYVDVVLVARMQTALGNDHSLTNEDWGIIPAFAKVGLEPEINVVDIEGVEEEVKEVEVMFLS